MLLELKVLLELLELAEDGRRSIQGTATCLPELLLELERPELLPEELLLGLVLPPELLLGLELELLPNELLEEPEELDDGLVLAPELLLEALELSDRIAKSIRPEFGFTIVSLIVPRVSPLEPVTLAPMSWLALRSWCPMRPVALHWCFEPYWLWLDLPLDEPYWPDWLLDELGSWLLDEEPLDELCACAPTIMHAAQNVIILSSWFFINPAFLGTVFCFPWKTTLLGAVFQQYSNLNRGRSRSMGQTA